MAKPEWGTKRTCPKCGTRFYDLGKEPAECIDCGHAWTPEPVLKSKQPHVAEEKVKEKAKKTVDDEEEEDDDDDDLLDDDDDIEIDDDGDDVLAADLDDDDDDVTTVIDAPVEKDTD